MQRRHARSAAIVWVGLLLLAAAPAIMLGQARSGSRNGAAATPAAKPLPIVVVTRTDATTVRGQITSADPDKIIIQPAPRPGQQAPAEPMTLAWSEIKTISSGLTRAKALEDWKTAHRSQLCPTCLGDRVVRCSVCKGTGHDPASGAECPKCKAELLIDCPTPKCDHGKIPCTNGCLKFSEGQWGVQNGQKVRFFRTGNATAWISENHIGEVFQIDPKTGAPTMLGKCPVCGGKTVIDDPICHGTDKVPCPTCIARKDAAECPNHCDHGNVACETCKGTGLKV